MGTNHFTRADRDLATALFEHLLTLSAESRPDGGDGTALNKSYKANQALLYGGLLIDRLIGWAINHKIGVSLTGLKLGDRKQGKADSHSFEDLGFAWVPSDANQTREILATVVSTAGIIPAKLRQQLGEALRALNLGEQKPLLTPNPAGRWHGAHSLAQTRKLAIMHAYFLWGRGKHTKKKAIGEVASKLRVGVETAKTWDRRWLPDVEPDAKELFALAKRAGSLQQQLDRDPNYKSEDKVADALRQVMLTSHPLKQIAEDYRRALRTTRKPGRRTKG